MRKFLFLTFLTFMGAFNGTLGQSNVPNTTRNIKVKIQTKLRDQRPTKSIPNPTIIAFWDMLTNHVDVYMEEIGTGTVELINSSHMVVDADRFDATIADHVTLVCPFLIDNYQLVIETDDYSGVGQFRND